MNEVDRTSYLKNVQVTGDENECWPWTGDTYPNGFGRFQMSDGKLCAAHTFGWLLEHGSYPPGNLKHRCGCKLCQNPLHIRLQKDIGDEERFWKLVDKRGPDECWPWLGKLRQMSKDVLCGRFTLSDGRCMQAHRYAHELLTGEVLPNREFKPLCSTVGCVNPEHYGQGMCAADIERFWSKVEKQEDDGCWLWAGTIGPQGYGIICIDSNNHRTHRMAYELTNGPIPEGMLVCHKCDVPACVRPDHLFLGTHQDNADDKMAKGRHKCNPVKGEECSWSKVNEDIVREIRADTHSTRPQLAERYNVSVACIVDIQLKRRWKHVV